MLKDSFFTESWYLPWIRIAKDEVFLDIGANLGFYARRIAPMAGIVIAFDPNPFVFRKLVARTASFRNVKCFQFAVGAADEKVELFLHEQVAGASVTRRSRDSVRVNSVCLDRFVDSNLIDSLRVGLVKIDVEGS
jgi:FkbM family methyltransferase